MTPLQSLAEFEEHVEGAIALASNNGDAALAAIAEVEHRLVPYLKECAANALLSGSDFNQGVVRGLEIAAAQVEHGHYKHGDFFKPADEWETNANLIIAASEMCAALTAIGYWPSVRAAIGDRLCAQLDAALAKAHGEQVSA